MKTSEAPDYVESEIIKHVDKQKARLAFDNAFCNAVLAIQDNYAYDAPEQAQMIRNLAKCTTVDELNTSLGNCDVEGFDLNMPLRDHVKFIENRNKVPCIGTI